MDSTRRGFLHSAGLTGLGASTAAAGRLLSGSGSESQGKASPGPVPTVPQASFYGAHQAGIGTPAQDYLQFASLDVVSTSVTDLRELMITWTRTAALMASGSVIGPVETGSKPAVDTGEAIGLPASNLTVTFGFGPTLFMSNGKDRFGLAARRPAPLADLPAFRTDALRAGISGGDLGIQVCANNPQVAFHAVHELVRQANPVARLRWLLAGSGRTGNSQRQPMPRNLMGFFDGTANIMAEDSTSMNNFVWASPTSSPAWMRGGSYLVARRIQIELGKWDATAVSGQEHTIGRKKLSGNVLAAPLPAHSHILLSSPRANNGERILRRGYSYFDGVDHAYGAPATGLMFLCYQSDPRKQFVPIQRKLAAGDALNKFIRHIGSAIFACPPGASSPSGYVGERLLR
ncbi:MAG TPA: Dyp-type peroxidase [Streptosporangiaceae bacterium]